MKSLADWVVDINVSELKWWVAKKTYGFECYLGKKHPQLVTLPGVSHEISYIAMAKETTSSYF
jgi:hypothetical protein